MLDFGLAKALEVEPRRYRFRILNASNARFFRLTWRTARAFIRSEPTRVSWPRLLKLDGYSSRPESELT